MSLFLSDLELTIVSTSLVSITNAFAAFQKSSWVVTAYFLTFTGTQALLCPFPTVL